MKWKLLKRAHPERKQNEYIIPSRCVASEFLKLQEEVQLMRIIFLVYASVSRRTFLNTLPPRRKDGMHAAVQRKLQTFLIDFKRLPEKQLFACTSVIIRVFDRSVNDFLFSLCAKNLIDFLPANNQSGIDECNCYLTESQETSEINCK